MLLHKYSFFGVLNWENSRSRLCNILCVACIECLIPHYRIGIPMSAMKDTCIQFITLIEISSQLSCVCIITSDLSLVQNDYEL